MKLENQQHLPCDRQTAWLELNSVEVLQKCIPGCERVERTADNAYEAVVKTKIGPVKATFKGDVEIEEIEPLSRYRISGAGKGGMAGFAKGEAQVTLEEIIADETKLTYEVNAKIGGKIAMVGSRLVSGVVENLANQFFDNFRLHLEEKRPGPAE